MTALTRTAAGVPPAAPIRIVHLGLGIFHRTHQAWYTEHLNRASASASAGPYGIAAFTGRRPDAAVRLQQQGGLYHVVIRGPEGDVPELVSSISAAVDGNDFATWCAHIASPAVECLTLTVTEAGYRRSPAGGLDMSDPLVVSDVSASIPSTAPGRIVRGLDARRRSDGGPIAIVTCDNLTDNGPTCQRVVLEMASAIDSSLADWISSNVSFVSTMVDRITPRTTADDIALVHSLTGFDDVTPVVSEPFAEWILAGSFPAGRPDWDLVGARFVPDVRPFEQRKLWLLNGSHSLLAYAGATQGHQTVAEAIADPVCRGWVEHWWDEACRHLSLPTEELTKYREDLLERYSNPGIRHQLAQIQMDGSQKLPNRLVPVIARERANGDLPTGAVITLAGWLAHLRDAASVDDPRAAELIEAVRGSDESATRRLLTAITPTSGLADDAELVRAVAACYRELVRV